MGEYEQPVVGMKSCFDFSEEQGLLKDWCAREWFVVNKAEIQLTDDNLMMPRVKMGVEARETFLSKDRLEDVPLTRPDHPLVKYASAFTHYFDLIAERKSVICQLRELAKASVLAKFLVESEARLEDPWLALAPPALPATRKEIPQLWNEQRVSQIQVEDGQIVTSAESLGGHMHGVYGGVEMGLDRVGRAAAVPGRVPVAKVSVSRAPALSSRLIQSRTGVAEFPLPAAPVVPAPKGVDLNLDKFSLSAPVEADTQAPEGSWGGEGLVGNAFWAAMSDPKVNQQDQELLKDLFNPHLCDRRDEGDLFVPPDTSLVYVSALRELIKEEAKARQERKERFLSLDFIATDPGHVFPSSWSSPLGIAHGQHSSSTAQLGQMHPRPDYRKEAAKLLKSAAHAPFFDKSTEDGTRFRIYRIGSIEVRSTQEHDGQEVVGAVFADRAAAAKPPVTPTTVTIEEAWSTVAQVDKVVKAVAYVEKAQGQSTATKAEHRFYVVLETNQGDAVVTERLPDGTLTWAANPADLEYRNSLAKVVCAIGCSTTGISVREMRAHLGDPAAAASGTASASRCYARSVLMLARPAREKAWATLTEREACVAQQLGAANAEAWDNRAAQVWSQPWRQLTQKQREAAEALGFARMSWHSAENKLGGTWEKSWEELTGAERRAAKVLRLTSAEDWEEAPWERRGQQPRSLWERSWAQLTAEEREATAALGVAGADAWDEAAWLPMGAWAEPWQQLTEQERHAAQRLGVACAGAWDAAFGGEGKRGQGLGGVWERSWLQLSEEERSAARQLGIAGAGAWDKSKAQASVDRQWAQLTELQQEAQMEEWFKRHGQSLTGVVAAPVP